jgi:hypothetical protein
MENNIKINIRKIFKISEKKYQLIKNDNTYNIIIGDGTNNCIDITIYIDTNDIYINHIDKCKFYRGKQSMENILEFAKELNISKISLQDKSTITIDGCNFILPYYYILLNGVSWYNSFGFKSINYDEEQSINFNIPMMNLNEFKNILIENYNDKVKKQIFVDKFEETINLICLNQKQEISEKLQNIIDISSNIKELIQNLVQNIDDEICLFLQCIIFVSKMYVIKYNPNLQYINDYVGYGKKRKTKRKKTKHTTTTKHKKYK